MHLISGIFLIIAGIILASPSFHDWLILIGRGSAFLVILGLTTILVGLILIFSRCKK